jgi:TRAP-type C4-dicarboxylate transport system substrate-binding protein
VATSSRADWRQYGDVTHIIHCGLNDMAAARLLLCAIGCLLSLADGVHAKQVKLKAALRVPITELLFGRSLAEFRQEVEALTRNGVAIEIFDGGKPYNDTQSLDAVTSGDRDLLVVAFNHFSDKIPAIGILDQPFLFNFDAGSVL